MARGSGVTHVRSRCPHSVRARSGLGPGEGHDGEGGPARPRDPTAGGIQLSADREQDGLDRLVERTSGPQPWRRLFHAFTGVFIAALLTYAPISQPVALGLLGGALLALVALDAIRLRSRRANHLFFRSFEPLVSPREARGPASSTWYALGVLLVVALFAREVAVSAILVLAIADPAASYLGRRWGRRPFLGGSVLGSGTFLLVSGVILAARHEPLPAAVAALVVTLAERRSWPLDDNLAVPLVCAAVLAGMGMVT